MYIHLIPIVATENKWQEKMFLAFLFRVSLYMYFYIPPNIFSNCLISLNIYHIVGHKVFNTISNTSV